MLGRFTSGIVLRCACYRGDTVSRVTLHHRRFCSEARRSPSRLYAAARRSEARTLSFAFRIGRLFIEEPTSPGMRPIQLSASVETITAPSAVSPAVTPCPAFGVPPRRPLFATEKTQAATPGLEGIVRRLRRFFAAAQSLRPSAGSRCVLARVASVFEFFGRSL